MTYQPSIIDCSGIVFVTMPFPSGPVTKLIPDADTQRELAVDVDLRISSTREYFMVTIDTVQSITKERWNEKVSLVLELVWRQLVERGLVAGPMPEIIQGNPLDMLPG